MMGFNRTTVLLLMGALACLVAGRPAGGVLDELKLKERRQGAEAAMLQIDNSLPLRKLLLAGGAGDDDGAFLPTGRSLFCT
jgi:hypothetical protein